MASRTGQAAEATFTRLVRRTLIEIVDGEPAPTPGTPTSCPSVIIEAYRRLLAGSDLRWSRRRLFFKTASRELRAMLAEAGRGAVTGWEPADPSVHDGSFERALRELEALDPVSAEVVELRRYAGLRLRDIAAALGIPLEAAEARWRFGRAFLFSKCGRNRPDRERRSS